MKALRTFRISIDVTVEDDQPDDYTHEDAVIRAAEDAARRLMCDGGRPMTATTFGPWSKPHHGNFCDHYATTADGTRCERCGATRSGPTRPPGPPPPSPTVRLGFTAHEDGAAEVGVEEVRE